jgi:acyl-CoA-dependent ceramide synthase
LGCNASDASLVFQYDWHVGGYPHKTLEGVYKAYYLPKPATKQQAIVLMLQLEKPRKDFKELVGHHIITLALIGLSYRFHFT